MRAAASTAIIRTTKLGRKFAAPRWQQHEYYQRSTLSSSQFLHTHAGGSLEDYRRREKQEKSQKQLSSLQVAEFHATPQNEKAVAIVLGLGAVSALSYAGASAVRAYKEYQASLPSEEELAEQRRQQEEEVAKQEEEQQAQANAKQKQQDASKQKDGGKRENVFAKWFGVGVGAKYYEGGFEDTMTRREAALILGVRESSPPSRIKEAHRKLLVLNHPDTGGSTYVAGKINEAKELLLKGKRVK